MGAFTPNVDLTSIKRLFGAVEQPGGFIVSDLISPVIEIQNLALMQRREHINAFSSFGAVGAVIGEFVPEGEFWLVHSIVTDTDVLDADQALQYSLLLIPPTSSSSHFRYDQPVSINPSSEGGLGRIFEPPLILGPRMLIGMVANEITPGVAGVIAMGQSVTFTRITQ